MSLSISSEQSPGLAPASSTGSGRSQSQSGSESAQAATPPSAAEGSAAAEVSTAAEVTSAAKEISTFLSSSKTNIAFALDQSSGQMVVTITDASTGKTIRQIPSEVVLQIAQELKQNKTVASLQIDEKA